MAALDEYLRNDGFAKFLGIELLEAENGRALARMPITTQHLNSHGTLHGGAIFSLADAVFAAASNSHGVVAFAINCTISYFKALKEGVVIARAEEVSLNPALATYDIRITSEDSGELIALFQGTVYRKRQQISH
jgi:acyl-CoA thioesterase